MCCSLRYNSLIRVGWVERVWASREIRVFFSGWVYRLHSLSHAAQGRIVFFLSPDCDFWRALICSLREERREPNAVCFPAFPDPRPCQLLSMSLANTATLLRAPAVLLQVGGGDGGWRCLQNPEITKEETGLEAKHTLYEYLAPTCPASTPWCGYAGTDLSSSVGLKVSF